MCADYDWGGSFKGYLSESNLLRGRFGVAPTPGSTQILDRETGQLTACTKETCRYGDFYDDIGWVNRAPYMAFGKRGNALGAACMQKSNTHALTFSLN